MVEKKPFKWSWREIKPLLSRSYAEFNEDDAPRLGASLAYYTILSLAPLLILIITVAGFVFGRDAVQGQLMNQVSDLIGSQGGRAVQDMVRSASETKSTGIWASILGILTLLWGATSVVSELRADLNKIWDVPRENDSLVATIKQRSYLLGVILGTGFLLLVSLSVSAGLAATAKLMGDVLPVPSFFLHAFDYLISLLVIAMLFAVLFRYLPAITLQWRDVLLGAVFTAVLFNLGKLLLGLYLGRASFGSTFGAAGSLVIVLVWVYYSAQIFFFGAEFTKVFTDEHGSVRLRSRSERRAPVSATQPPQWMSLSSNAASGNAALPPIMPIDDPNKSRGLLGFVAALLGSALGLSRVVRGLKR